MTPEAARKFKMLSGKCKGKPLAFVPMDYLEWIVREHSNETLREAAKVVLKTLKSLKAGQKVKISNSNKSVHKSDPFGEMKKLLDETSEGLF